MQINEKLCLISRKVFSRNPDSYREQRPPGMHSNSDTTQMRSMEKPWYATLARMPKDYDTPLLFNVCFFASWDDDSIQTSGYRHDDLHRDVCPCPKAWRYQFVSGLPKL